MNTFKASMLVIGVAGLLAGCASKATEPAPEPTPPASYAAPAHEHATVHHMGTKGMKSLQRALADRRYYHGAVDGVDGPKTHAAVARYQQDLGVDPTGNVDEKTWSSLNLSE